MFAIIGIVVVIGSVVGGYLLSHGNMKVLFQPYEMLIIMGAAMGTLLIANPLSVVMGVAKGVMGILKSSPYSRMFYLEQLKMLNDIFNYARKNGLVKLEQDVEEPEKSQLFTKYPKFIKDRQAVH